MLCSIVPILTTLRHWLASMERIRLQLLVKRQISKNVHPCSDLFFVQYHVGLHFICYTPLTVIIGPGPHWFHWFHELQRSWFEQRSQIHTIARCFACALLFTLFSAQFLVHVLSNGGDRGVRVRVITAMAVWL